MTRLLKDTSLFAVYDPDTDREDLYQYSGEQLVDDVVFTIEDSINDILSVEILPPALVRPGGHLALVNNTFYFTPAMYIEPDEASVHLNFTYYDYLGNVVLENGAGDDEKVFQSDYNAYYSEQTNINTLFRVAQQPADITNWGIEYDDADSPTFINNINANFFVAENHTGDLSTEPPSGEDRSEVVTMDDMVYVRDYLESEDEDIRREIENIREYVRATDKINEGSFYNDANDDDTYSDWTNVTDGKFPELSQHDDVDGDALPATYQVVFSYADGVSDQTFTNATRVRIHETGFYGIAGDVEDPDSVLITYNYSNFITGSYIYLEGNDEAFTYRITGHIPHDTEDARSKKIAIPGTDEFCYQFEVEVIGAPDRKPGPDSENKLEPKRVQFISFEQGLNLDQADDRYINRSGDTMNGTLKFANTTSYWDTTNTSGERSFTCYPMDNGNEIRFRPSQTGVFKITAYHRNVESMIMRVKSGGAGVDCDVSLGFLRDPNNEQDAVNLRTLNREIGGIQDQIDALPDAVLKEGENVVINSPSLPWKIKDTSNTFISISNDEMRMYHVSTPNASDLNHAANVDFVITQDGILKEYVDTGFAVVDHTHDDMAPTVEVVGTETLAPGNNAEVINEGDGTNAKLRFKIPKGDKGDKGANGTNGTNGTNGADGKDLIMKTGTSTNPSLNRGEMYWNYNNKTLYIGN